MMKPKKNTCKMIFLMIAWIVIPLGMSAQINVIFDTDIGSDCDDAGAMAVLHKLADRGEVNIIGVMFSSNANRYGVGACHAINTYYGRPDIPIGQYMGEDEIGDPNDSYSALIARATDKYGHSLVDSTTEIVSLYKKLLADQTDSSVTLVSVGHPVALFHLIRDPQGMDLVKRKVTKWVAMTHTDRIPQNDWNFGRNGTDKYIKELLKRWPTDAYFSGAGEDIITGNRKLPNTGDRNPVKAAYEFWPGNALKNGRSSWDQIAVLFAVRPEYFNIEPGCLRQNDNMETFWTTAIDPDLTKRFKVVPRIPKDTLEDTIETLMAENPR
ncbi:hypothetical protein [Parapedobacter defluvii]|nr:hypothetical protein [Parapedobacter defluvii]